MNAVYKDKTKVIWVSLFYYKEWIGKKNRCDWDDYGRPKVKRPRNWDEVISDWKSGKITAVEAMKRTGIKKSIFYRLVKTLNSI